MIIIPQIDVYLARERTNDIQSNMHPHKQTNKEKNLILSSRSTIDLLSIKLMAQWTKQGIKNLLDCSF